MESILLQATMSCFNYRVTLDGLLNSGCLYSCHCLDNCLPGLAVGRLGGVHLVTGDDELLDPQGVGEQSVLPGLSVLGDAGLELAHTLGNGIGITKEVNPSTGVNGQIRKGVPYCQVLFSVPYEKIQTT